MARFCTTYDAAVYALILALQSQEPMPPVMPCQRFGTSGLQKFRDDERGIKLARLSLISFGEKIRDDRMDNHSLKTVLVSAPLRKSIAKACAAEPEMAEGSYQGTETINRLQDANAPLLEILGAYGDMAIGSFSHFMELTPETEELLRSVSEWIFLVDMACDYADDYKTGAYNGFKTQGAPTFADYYDRHYLEFNAVANKVTDRFLAALMAVKQESTVWNTLFKICVHALDTVLPQVVLGEDVSYHYFKDLFNRMGEMKKLEKDIKRLGSNHHEKS